MPVYSVWLIANFDPKRSNTCACVIAAKRIDHERMPGSHEEKYSVFDGRSSAAAAPLASARNHADYSPSNIHTD
jgi:hypothetical protein